MLYELRDIQAAYGDKVVIDVPHLCLEQGLINAVLGPNACGKTTLFMLLSFLKAPHRGTMSFQGKQVSYSRRNMESLRKEVVLIPQNPVMFTTSVLKNVEFGLKVRGESKSAREKTALAALDIVGMRDQASRPAHRLSGGETQRVAIARGLALSPKVLLCDEPVANVDTANRETVIRAIKDINEEKKITVFFTSHDTPWAEKLAQHIIFLENGTCVEAPDRK